MGITEASIFLTSTLLVSLGIIVIVAGALIVNNMIHRWWKPFEWSVVPNTWKQVAHGDFTDLESSAKKHTKEPTLDEIVKK
ncbi:hypothetical protein [uncultured phage]|nr:hypothetical protein [uncultured phage]